MCVHAKIIATYHDAFYSKPHAARTFVCSHTQETATTWDRGCVLRRTVSCTRALFPASRAVCYERACGVCVPRWVCLCKCVCNPYILYLTIHVNLSNRHLKYRSLLPRRRQVHSWSQDIWTIYNN